MRVAENVREALTLPTDVRNREHSGQRKGAQRSLSGSLSAQSGEKVNMGKEKSTGLNRFVIVCKAYVAKTPLPKGSGNSSSSSSLRWTYWVTKLEGRHQT